MPNKLGKIAGIAGRGAAAGVIATAAMAVSSTIEMKIRGRDPSDAPVRAAGKVLGVQPRDPEGAKRFGNLAHWGYGTMLGSVGGILQHYLPTRTATGTHFASIWGGEMTMLPRLGIGPPPTKWGTTELGIDGWHHAIYALAFAAAWQLVKPEPTTALRWGFFKK